VDFLFFSYKGDYSYREQNKPKKYEKQNSNLPLTRKLTAKEFTIFVAHIQMDILEADYMIFHRF